jgi:hypothetical protein
MVLFMMLLMEASFAFAEISDDNYRACDCEPGNADADQYIGSILDIVYIIYYRYKSGPAPTPYETCSGDPMCDCDVDIIDIVYLINFRYKDGPPPCMCDLFMDNCGGIY